MMTDYDPSTDLNKLNQMLKATQPFSLRHGKNMARQLLFLYAELETFTAENERLAATQAVHDETTGSLQEEVDNRVMQVLSLEAEITTLTGKIMAQSEMIGEMTQELNAANAQGYAEEEESLLSTMLEDDPVAALESLFDLSDEEDEDNGQGH